MKFLRYQYIRFILTGLINTIFGYGLYIIFLYLKLTPTYSMILTTIFGIIFNFKTIGTYVFKNKSKFLFFKFILVYLITLSFNIETIQLISKFYSDSRIAGFLSIILGSVLSFTLNKKFVFNQS
jgi:putative flippase GtrA